MRVYYFTPEQFALSNIINERIKISLLDDLNDPFELLGVNLSSCEEREAFLAARDEAAKMHGVICFSRSWKNPLMWSHYADKHKGICMGFDVADEYIDEMSYVRKKLPTLLDMSKIYGGLTIDVVKSLMNTKYIGWKYENEVRVRVALEEKDISGLYFTPFQGNMMLREVILGPRSPLSLGQVAKYLCSYKTNVAAFKTKIGAAKYEVARDKSIPIYVHKSAAGE